MEVIRAVVITAVGHQYRERVGAVPAAHQAVASDLAGAVGAVWLIAV